MRLHFHTLCCAAFLFAAEIGLAQDPLPSPSSPITSPAAAASPAQQTQLIPPPLPPPAGASALPSPPANMPELSALDAMFKQSSLGKEADDYKRHMEWRKLANQVAGESGIIAAKASAAAATTDLEKRKRLRIYYNLCFDRMGALASTPELKAYLEARRAEHLRLLDQPKVRPTPVAGQSPAR